MDNNKIPKTEHENVMLLAMSTLPQSPKVNTYQFSEEGKTVYFKSFSRWNPIQNMSCTCWLPEEKSWIVL